MRMYVCDRRTTYADATYCYRPSSVVRLTVGLSVTDMISAKTAEPIKIPFGLRTRVGLMNHVLDGGADPSWKGASLRENGVTHCKLRLPSMSGGNVAF